MQEKIKNGIKEALKNLEINSEDIVLEHPEDFKNGDFSTNVAMVYAKEIKMKPVDLAEKIIAEIARLNSDNGIEGVEEIEIAGPGFINFFYQENFLLKASKKF